MCKDGNVIRKLAPHPNLSVKTRLLWIILWAVGEFVFCGLRADLVLVKYPADTRIDIHQPATFFKYF